MYVLGIYYFQIMYYVFDQNCKSIKTFQIHGKSMLYVISIPNCSVFYALCFLSYDFHQMIVMLFKKICISSLTDK